MLSSVMEEWMSMEIAAPLSPQELTDSPLLPTLPTPNTFSTWPHYTSAYQYHEAEDDRSYNNYTAPSFAQYIPHSNSSFSPLLANETSKSNVSLHNPGSCHKTTKIPDHRFDIKLLLVFLPVIILAGTVGNILSIIVLKRRVMQMAAASFYLIVLAIPDMTVLYFSALKTWIRLLTGIEMLHYSSWSCKILKYFFYTSQHLSAWLVVAITIERLMVVRFPFKASKICCHRQAHIVTAITTLVIMALNVNIIVGSDLVPVHNPNSNCPMHHCVTSNDHLTYMRDVFPYINLFIYSVVPFSVVLVMNLIIIVSIVKTNKLLKNQPVPKPHQSLTHEGQQLSSTGSEISSSTRQQQRQNRLTLTLLTISILWFVLTAPYTIVDILSVQTKIRMAPIVRFICYLLMYVNHAINFYIYCLTGRKFRHELRRVFCRQWKPPVYHKVPFKQTPVLLNSSDKQELAKVADDINRATPNNRKVMSDRQNNSDRQLKMTTV